MRKITFALFLMASLDLFACKIERARSETHFVLDPTFQNAILMSKANLATIDVSSCDGSVPYLMIGSSVVFYQNDTAKRETLLGDVDPSKNNCSIEFPARLKSAKSNLSLISHEKVSSHIHESKRFVDQCVSYRVYDLLGRSLQIENSSSCKIQEELKPSNGIQIKSYSLSGAGCLVQAAKGLNLRIETKADVACAKNFGRAQDVETQLNVWPARVVQKNGVTSYEFDQPLSSRPVRYTLTPDRLKLAGSSAIQKHSDSPAFSQTLGTNIDFAKLDVSMIGESKYAVRPTFFVNNDSKSYCDSDKNCFNPSDFATPVAADVELFEVASERKYKASLGRWVHAVRVPPRFIGFAEVTPESNLSGTPSGALVLDRNLTEGKVYALEVNFFEPRALMDNDARIKKLFSGDVSLPKVERGIDEGALPSVPQLGINTGLQPFLPIQSTKLSEAGFDFFSNRPNMKQNWTNHFELVCNSDSAKCQRVGVSRPFIKLMVTFKVSASGQAQVLRTQKISSVFESYNLEFNDLAESGSMKKVCR